MKEFRFVEWTTKNPLFQFFKEKKDENDNLKPLKLAKHQFFFSLLQNCIFRSIAVFENSGETSWKRSLHVFILCSHFLANSQTMCYYKQGSYISWLWNGAHTSWVSWKLSKGCKLYNYRARNRLKMSSKVYKFVPVLGVKNKTSAKWMILKPRMVSNSM